MGARVKIRLAAPPFIDPRIGGSSFRGIGGEQTPAKEGTIGGKEGRKI